MIENGANFEKNMRENGAKTMENMRENGASLDRNSFFCYIYKDNRV